MLIVREIAPYENPSTNILANLAQLQLLATYLVAYMLLTELEDASQGKLVLWGVLLLVINLGTVLLAIWLQVTESNRQIVLQLVRLVAWPLQRRTLTASCRTDAARARDPRRRNVDGRAVTPC